MSHAISFIVKVITFHPESIGKIARKWGAQECCSQQPLYPVPNRRESTFPEHLCEAGAAERQWSHLDRRLLFGAALPDHVVSWGQGAASCSGSRESYSEEMRGELGLKKGVLVKWTCCKDRKWVDRWYQEELVRSKARFLFSLLPCPGTGPST